MYTSCINTHKNHTYIYIRQKNNEGKKRQTKHTWKRKDKCIGSYVWRCIRYANLIPITSSKGEVVVGLLVGQSHVFAPEQVGGTVVVRINFKLKLG